MTGADKPVRLVTHTDASKQETDASIINILERWLVRARAGEFTGLAVMASLPDGFSITFSSTLNRMEFAGLLATLQYRMLKQHDEDDADNPKE